MRDTPSARQFRIGRKTDCLAGSPLRMLRNASGNFSNQPASAGKCMHFYRFRSQRKAFGIHVAGLAKTRVALDSCLFRLPTR
jgi:hypothetical protein